MHKNLILNDDFSQHIKFSVMIDNKLNIGSGYKPLPEPMLTQIYVIKWHH